MLPLKPFKRGRNPFFSVLKWYRHKSIWTAGSNKQGGNFYFQMGSTQRRNTEPMYSIHVTVSSHQLWKEAYERRKTPSMFLLSSWLTVLSDFSLHLHEHFCITRFLDTAWGTLPSTRYKNSWFNTHTLLKTFLFPWGPISKINILSSC